MFINHYIWDFLMLKNIIYLLDYFQTYVDFRLVY
jgi:hypothetical protein